MRNEWNKRPNQFLKRVQAAIGCLMGQSVIFRHNVVIHGFPSGTTTLPENTAIKGLSLSISLDYNKASFYECNLTTPEFGFKNKEQVK